MHISQTEAHREAWEEVLMSLSMWRQRVALIPRTIPNPPGADRSQFPPKEGYAMLVSQRPHGGKSLLRAPDPDHPPKFYSCLPSGA